MVFILIYSKFQCMVPHSFLLLLKILLKIFTSSHFSPIPPITLPLPLQSKEQSGFPALWEVQGPPPHSYTYGQH